MDALGRPRAGGASCKSPRVPLGCSRAHPLRRVSAGAHRGLSLWARAPAERGACARSLPSSLPPSPPRPPPPRPRPGTLAGPERERRRHLSRRLQRSAAD